MPRGVRLGLRTIRAPAQASGAARRFGAARQICRWRRRFLRACDDDAGAPRRPSRFADLRGRGPLPRRRGRIVHQHFQSRNGGDWRRRGGRAGPYAPRDATRGEGASIQRGGETDPYRQGRAGTSRGCGGGGLRGSEPCLGLASSALSGRHSLTRANRLRCLIEVIGQKTMRFRTWSHRASLLILFAMIGGGLALAQDSDLGERSIGASAPAPRAAASPAPANDIPAVVIAPSRSAAKPRPSAASPESSDASQPAPPPKPHKYFPYTIRPGDTLGSIAQYFGVPVAQLAKLNHLHEDDELIAGDALKVPNPFEAQQKGLESQVDQLSAQLRATEQRLQQAESQVVT